MHFLTHRTPRRTRPSTTSARLSFQSFVPPQYVCRKVMIFSTCNIVLLLCCSCLRHAVHSSINCRIYSRSTSVRQCAVHGDTLLMFSPWFVPPRRHEQLLKGVYQLSCLALKAASSEQTLLHTFHTPGSRSYSFVSLYRSHSDPFSAGCTTHKLGLLCRYNTIQANKLKLNPPKYNPPRSL